MSRYSREHSYGYTMKRLSGWMRGDFEISWVVDFYYPSSRLRFPRRFRRITDERGAKKFCEKHSILWPP